MSVIARDLGATRVGRVVARAMPALRAPIVRRFPDVRSLAVRPHTRVGVTGETIEYANVLARLGFDEGLLSCVAKEGRVLVRADGVDHSSADEGVVSQLPLSYYAIIALSLVIMLQLSLFWVTCCFKPNFDKE